MTKINQLLPGQVAWTSPKNLGMDEKGDVWLNSQGECVPIPLPRSPTQSAKVVMNSESEASVNIPITWENALPKLSFKNKLKVIGVRTR